MGFRNHFVAVVAAFALLAAACGDDDAEQVEDDDAAAVDDAPSDGTADDEGSDEPAADDADPEEPEPGKEAEPLTASFRGVTPTEIHIGIGINDATEFGVDNGDKEAKFMAVIDEINNAGGIHGRLLVPHVAEYPSTGSVEQEAACVAHTEDVEVFAFIGEARQNNELCYTEGHDTIVVNGFFSTEEAIERSDGLLYSVEPSALGVELLAVQAAGAAGLLDGEGVFVHARAETADLIPAVRAALEAEGADVLGELVPNTTQGDIPAIQSEADTHIERVESDGGSTVFSIGDAGLTMTGAAQRTGRDVTIITTFASGDIYVTLGYDPAKVNLEVFSPRPLDDVHAAGEAGIPECIERFETASGEVVNIGVPDPTPDNFVATIRACKTMDLFTQIAKAAGPVLTNDSFREAAAGLGEFDLVGATAASLGPDKYAADDSPLLHLLWDADAQAFVTR